MTITPAYVDATLALILLIFAFLAFLKGFVKDFFSTVNLILATVISYTVSPFISKLISQDKVPQLVVDLGSQFVLFIILLIIFSIISSKISTPLAEKIPNAINQSLGFAFGLMKGYLIVAFIFSCFIYFYSFSSKSQKVVKKVGPEWLQKSKTYDILEFGTNIFNPIIKDAFLRASGKIEKNIQDKQMESMEDLMKAKKLYEEIETSPLENDNNVETQEKDTGGYTKQEIDKMKRLIEIMNN